MKFRYVLTRAKAVPFAGFPIPRVDPCADHRSRGQTIANLETVALPVDGNVDLYNELGTVDLIADVVGYYAAI